MMGRAAAVVLLGLLLTALVVRNALVDAYVETKPDRAAIGWSGHPSVILASGLAEVGAAAAAGRPVSPASVRRMLDTSARAPLAPEPYLVRGVAAQVAGDQTLALRAFLEARHRDPRSIAARYFLAGHYLQAGQTRAGLAEISALTRLVPKSLKSVSPQLAAFARMPGGASQVKALLRDQPQLEPWLLDELAASPDDARLVMSLWSGRTIDRDRSWQGRLINTLIAAGRYQDAQSAWQRFDPAIERSGALVDPQFNGKTLPPFGWTLASGAAGVAEPQGGNLHVIYYGRDDHVLASQLLLLKPGSYRLAMRVGAASPGAKALAWTIRCLPAARELATIGLGSSKGGVVAGHFVVPAAGCEAQQLELAGTAPELPEQAEATIIGLSLSRSGR